MPQVEIKVGGRTFEVACQEGEEKFLQAAAVMLDTEAAALSSQIGRMPESRMLLMSGLLLADKTAGLEDKLRGAEARARELEEKLLSANSKPAPDPEVIEIPIIPLEVTDTLAELAARAEALADDIDSRQS